MIGLMRGVSLVTILLDFKDSLSVLCIILLGYLCILL